MILTLQWFSHAPETQELRKGEGEGGGVPSFHVAVIDELRGTSTRRALARTLGQPSRVWSTLGPHVAGTRT